MSTCLTFLLITQTQLARIDVAGGKNPRAKGVWTRDRIPGESIATLADAAIRLGPKKTGDVWVFSDEFWTGVVHVAADIAGALDGEELDQAIALEAETFSGISAFESRLGLKALPKSADGEAQWWVTQIGQSDWHEVGQVASQFRGKLAGMGHPALAAFPNDSNGDTVSEIQRWRLNQAFGESTISVNGVGDEIREVITLGDVKTQHTRAQLLDWCDDTGHHGQSLVWVADQRLPDLLVDDCCSQISLSTEAAVSDTGVEADAVDQTPSDCTMGEAAFGLWAETMARSLPRTHRCENRLPVVLAQKPPMSQQTALLVACGLGLLVGLGCLGMHSVIGTQLAGLNERVETFTKAKKSLSEDKQALLAVKKELTEKQRAVQDLTKTNQDLSAGLSKATRIRHFQQTRWLRLISALSRSSDGGCWVRGLDMEGKVVKVRGLSLSNQEISVFASNLEKYASPYGWTVHPAQTEQSELSLIEFEVSLDVSDQAAPGLGTESSLADSASSLSLITAPVGPFRMPIGPRQSPAQLGRTR